LYCACLCPDMYAHIGMHALLNSDEKTAELNLTIPRSMPRRYVDSFTNKLLRGGAVFPSFSSVAKVAYGWQATVILQTGLALQTLAQD